MDSLSLWTPGKSVPGRGERGQATVQTGGRVGRELLLRYTLDSWPPLGGGAVNRPMSIALHVECYAGYRANERPLRFRRAGPAEDARRYEVQQVLNQGYSPGCQYFQVRADEEQRRRCGLVVNRVRLPAEGKARI